MARPVNHASNVTLMIYGYGMIILSLNMWEGKGNGSIASARPAQADL
jgi:hypothetical protein